jgi:hypothetical protein
MDFASPLVCFSRVGGLGVPQFFAACIQTEEEAGFSAGKALKSLDEN